MSKKLNKIQISILAIIACLIWGSAFAFAKVGFEYMPPLRLSGYRFMLAGLILLPILFYQKYDWRELKGQYGFIFLFALIQNCLQYGLFYYGLNLVPASISAIIIGIGPLFITVLAHFTLKNDRLTTKKIVSIILGVSGVVFISLKNDVVLSENPHFYLGLVILTLSNIIGSSSNIVVARRSRPLSSISLNATSCLFGGSMLYIISLFIEPSDNVGIMGYPLKFYWSLLWLAMIPAVAFSLWYFLLKLPNVKVSELNIWKFLVPVFGVVLSWIMLENESANIYTIIGIIIISLSIIILQFPQEWIAGIRKLFKKR